MTYDTEPDTEHYNMFTQPTVSDGTVYHPVTQHNDLKDARDILFEPCPRCGKKDMVTLEARDVFNTWIGESRTMYRVRCTRPMCRFRNAVAWRYFDEVVNRDRELAVYYWNTQSEGRRLDKGWRKIV